MVSGCHGNQEDDVPWLWPKIFGIENIPLFISSNIHNIIIII